MLGDGVDLEMAADGADLGTLMTHNSVTLRHIQALAGNIVLERMFILVANRTLHNYRLSKTKKVKHIYLKILRLSPPNE